MDGNLLTVQQAAERLGVSFWTVYRMARAGELASVRIGRRRLFAAQDLEDLVKARRRERQTDPQHGDPRE
jgi:excisionase family DNA binding protein